MVDTQNHRAFSTIVFFYLFAMFNSSIAYHD